jgi:peroxiredoxin
VWWRNKDRTRIVLPPPAEKDIFHRPTNMMRLPKIVSVFAWILFVAASVAIHYEVKIGMERAGGHSVSQLRNVKVGEPAPEFSLNDLSNQPVTLNSFRGKKIVLMDFWATWCGPCRMAMPDLQALNEKYKSRGLEILSLDQGEPAEQVRNFIERKKYTFHVLLDSEGTVGGKYGVKGIPTLVLADKQGVVRWLRVGYVANGGELPALVEKLTKE